MEVLAGDTTLSVTFASELTPAPQFLATLAVFYDKISLPYPYFVSPEDQVGDFWRNPVSVFPKFVGHLRSQYLAWQEKWSPLFDRGVVDILPRPQIPHEFVSQLRRHLGYPETSFGSPVKEMYDIGSGRMALAIHRLYSKSGGEEIYRDPATAPTTSSIQPALVEGLFALRVPMLGALSAQQVLDAREFVAGERQDFRTVVKQLAGEVRMRMINGVPLDAAIQKTLDESFFAAYEKFSRRYGRFHGHVATSVRHDVPAAAAEWGARVLGVVALPVSVVNPAVGVVISGGEKVLSAVAFLANKKDNVAFEITGASGAFVFLASLESQVNRRAVS